MVGPSGYLKVPSSYIAILASCHKDRIRICESHAGDALAEARQLLHDLAGLICWVLGHSHQVDGRFLGHEGVC